jgi:hypothetical protein
MNEVVVVCPLACNKSDTLGKAIYIGAITNPGSGATHAYSSLSSKLMVRVSAVRHYFQDFRPP